MQAPDRTFIATVRDHVEDWRRANQWSRETVVQQIVEAHERLGFDRLTGLTFDPTPDAYRRMKTNAERVYRWLDDHSKDNNLLNPNFLWSILAGMPEDRRHALAFDLLAPVDLSVIEVGFDPAAEDGDHALVMHFQAVVSSSADTNVAVASLLDGIDPGEPEAAQAKLGRSIGIFRRTLAAIGRLVKRKPKAAAR